MRFREKITNLKSELFTANEKAQLCADSLETANDAKNKLHEQLSQLQRNLITNFGNDNIEEVVLKSNETKASL
jgi:hypothetical protein